MTDILSPIEHLNFGLRGCEESFSIYKLIKNEIKLSNLIKRLQNGFK